jgi:hypothetical protein
MDKSGSGQYRVTCFCVPDRAVRTLCVRAWVQNVPPVNPGKGNIVAVGSVYKRNTFLCHSPFLVTLTIFCRLLVLGTSQSEEMTDMWQG